MKIVYIGTYFPRECGIGTFTRNKVEAMMNNGFEEEHEPIVVAINDNGNEYNYPPEVKCTIQRDLQSDYIAAAAFINESGADFCILEHVPVIQAFYRVAQSKYDFDDLKCLSEKRWKKYVPHPLP